MAPADQHDTRSRDPMSV